MTPAQQETWGTIVAIAREGSVVGAYLSMSVKRMDALVAAADELNTLRDSSKRRKPRGSQYVLTAKMLKAIKVEWHPKWDKLNEDLIATLDRYGIPGQGGQHHPQPLNPSPR